MKPRIDGSHIDLRHKLLLSGLLAGALSLASGALYLQLTQQDFLQKHARARQVTVDITKARRGLLTDRRGEPLAVSTEMFSVHANPAKLLEAREQWPALLPLLDMQAEDLKSALESRLKRGFVYLKRRIEPELADRIRALNIKGIGFQSEARRYYPAGEVAAQLLGQTDIDDIGREGLELAFEERLRGKPGKQKALKDAQGTLIESLENITTAEAGEDIRLSIDKRLQYVAYRELKSAVLSHRARGGMVVMMDARTGEILALVSQPSFNPNNRTSRTGRSGVNRALLDVFEPGSTIKPFTVAAALETGLFQADSEIDTHPGTLKVGGHTVRDIHRYGRLDVTGVIVKSSNVGTAKLALAMPAQQLWGMLDRVGFGRMTFTGFPGERGGLLAPYQDWREFQQATISFGYGISITAVQLAQAYSIFARDGSFIDARLEHQADYAEGRPIIRPEVAESVRTMLEAVVQRGTAQLAHVPGYRVGGKTGTVHKVADGGGYSADRYLSLFVGLAPMSSPRLITVVVVDEPQGSEYYGGRVAAPVFSRILSDSLRLLDIAPDHIESGAAAAIVGVDPEIAAEAGWLGVE